MVDRKYLIEDGNFNIEKWRRSHPMEQHPASFGLWIFLLLCIWGLIGFAILMQYLIEGHL